MNAVVIESPADQVVSALPATIPSATPAQMLMLLVQRNADLTTMEKFMELQERWEKNEARKAYFRAMADFKSKLIVVEKSGHVEFVNNKGGITKYDHETLFDVFEAAVPRMGEYGLSHVWELSQREGSVTVTCVISHRDGHTTSGTPITAPRDESGGKNTIQSIGSTIRYLERYTLEAALGLAPKKSDDDDGRGATTSEQRQQDPPTPRGKPATAAPRAKDGPKLCNSSQAKVIRAKLDASGLREKDFFGHFKIDAIDQIPFDRVNDCLVYIQRAAG